ncbi:MAG: alpha/beta fold hydrolase [Neoaquamicrobium sediminum]|uniref:alpha/beta fold hydrolase n=1 Tax=Neoaquamicrobium sediminum TaxID=1849104 RepID=UPI0040364463
MEESWLDVAGVRTRYLTVGKGERPVVFVHGGTIGDVSAGSSANDFNSILPLVGKNCEAIAVDRIGQGYTANPLEGDAEGWTMKGSVRHFITFLETLGKGPYHLVGHSRGGYVVTRTTLERPDLVESLTIGDSNTVAPGGARNEAIHIRNPYRPGTREAMEFTAQHYYFDPSVKSDGGFEKELAILEQPKIREAIRHMGAGGRRTRHYLPGLLADREDLFMRLEHRPLARRVLILWAYNDPTAPISMGYQLLRLVAKHQPKVSMHVVNQSGHSLYRERPAQFIRALKDHLDGCYDGN